MDRAHARRRWADRHPEPARPRARLRLVDGASAPAVSPDADAKVVAESSVVATTGAVAEERAPWGVEPARRTVTITGRPDPYRRPSRTAARVASRPDRVALWAVGLAVFLVLMAAATAKANSHYRYETLGNRVLKKGDAGSDVKTLQILLINRGYGIPRASGYFGAKTHSAVRRFQRRNRLAVDGRFGPQSRRALTRGWRRNRATWYGPGLYGNRTACGQTLRRKSWGVAHRSLPCGRRVAFKYGGRIVIARVIDRGPYMRGLSWDFTQRVAKALHMRTTSTVRVAD
jgi:rare lipoprotein A (peptidoglycan hydrolase)